MRLAWDTGMSPGCWGPRALHMRVPSMLEWGEMTSGSATSPTKIPAHASARVTALSAHPQKLRSGWCYLNTRGRTGSDCVYYHDNLSL